MINNLHLSNFKCFEDARISLRHLTVLAGSNSVGKTSVIQSILLVRTAIERLSRNNLLNELENVQAIHIPLNGKYSMALGNTLEVLTRDVNSNIITFSLFDDDKQSSISLCFLAEDNTDDFFDLQLYQQPVQTGYFDNLRNEFYYLNAERLGPRLSYDADQLDFMNVGCQGEYTIQILSQLKEKTIINPDVRKHPGSDDTKLLNQVRLWMNEVIPVFYLDDAVLEGKLKKAYSRYSKSSPTNVGFGISYVLPIIVNGLIAEPNTIFIIENPEAHLHPYGQSRIGRFLAHIAASQVQVIIETHSEHVINGIRLEAMGEHISPSHVLINFFHRQKESLKVNITEIELSETGDLSSFPRDFFDQVQQDLADIYRAKKVKLNG